VIYPGDLQDAYLGMSKKIFSNGAPGPGKAPAAAEPERKKFLGII
jgi:hypothetical protein